MTESFSDQDGRNFGESFKVDVKVIQVTMESGLGHRTVPLLLAESSLSGTAKNWSSLLYLCSDMTLEVRTGAFYTTLKYRPNGRPLPVRTGACHVFSCRKSVGGQTAVL